MKGFDAECWLIDRGVEIAEKKQEIGIEALAEVERLFLHVWYADYCMRNAGDLANLDELYPDCLEIGASTAEALGLPKTRTFFARSSDEFESHFFDDFDDVITELSQAIGSSE